MNTVKRQHAVFIARPEQLLRVLDEAWRRKRETTIDPRTCNWNYIVPADRVVGTSGEKNVLLSVNKNSN